MPSHALRAMTEDDLRRMYRFIRHLWPVGTAVVFPSPPARP